ncbi:MAG: aminotransferase class IV [Bacteroidales bacterium]|nr:aminotransferase class IV [Bacteroidales bacterium]
MTECLGKFYMKNGQLLETTFFDESFLSKPHYIYEVFRVIDGLPLFIEDHKERLKQTVELSGFPAELIPADFEKQVASLIHANELQEGNIKVVVLPAENDRELAFMIYIMEHQYPSASEFENGVELALHYGLRGNPNAKVMDVELRSNTNQIKKKQQVYETLLVDQDHCITEGSRSNVFFVRGEELITPPLADVLPGITRKHVMKLCQELAIPLREEKVSENSLGQMDAVFITGTSRKVLPACRIDEWLYPPDYPLVRKLQAAFNREVENYLQSKRQAGQGE